MALANPYLKVSRPRPPLVLKATPAVRCGVAQKKFIDATRKAVDLDPKFLQVNGWCRISHSNRRGSALVGKKKLRADDFYVKDMAVWVPHLIIPHYVPSCARCKKKDYVELSKCHWVENPKLLYGTHSHRYLDTKYYWCGKCESDFSGWHEATLIQDAKEITGILNFNLSKGFAVDDELYSFIVNHSNLTTASVHQMIKHMMADNWLNDAAFYYRAVMSDKVRARNPNVFDGTNQQSLDSLLVKLPKLTPAQKRIESTRFELTTVERELRSKELAHNHDVEFASVFRRKKNRNSINETFPGIGKAKCLALMRANIHTAKELLEYDGGNPTILEHWKDVVQAHYDRLQFEVNQLRHRQAKLREELQIDELMEDVTTTTTTTTTTRKLPGPVSVGLPPAFSGLFDSRHYNGRCVSKATVDRINATDFLRRKKIQLAKMRNIPASILKIDWSYKLPPKIKVYTGKGKAFSPFRSQITVQNEDAMTVFWKFYSGTESIDMAKADLVNLKRRLVILQRLKQPDALDNAGGVKATYVDNCCTVGPKLLTIFPGAFIKLDAFHWQVRWDDCLQDVKSETTVMFRKLMRRALFLTEDTELQRARDYLVSKKGIREPSMREIYKVAKATIPPPEELEARVMSVIHTLMSKDAESDRLATGSDVSGQTRNRFFKRGDITLKTIINQLKHVRKGCLSDPPKEAVQIHRINPVTGVARTGRSTGTNETENRYLNCLLDTPSIGLPRADRVIHNYYEESNDRKAVSRLGAAAGEAKRIEAVQALHGMACACGYKQSEIPFAKPAYPRDIDDLEEFIGFDYCLPAAYQEKESADAAADDDVGLHELDEFMRDVNFDDYDDLRVDPSQFTEQNAATGTSAATDDEPVDVFAFDVDADLSLCLPTIVEGEKTYDTYVRLTNGQLWVPFKDPSEESSFTESDRAEMQLWKEMSPLYDRNATPSSPKGYKTFADAWDNKVASIYQARLNGDDVVMINRKSYMQLQQQHDRIERQKTLLEMARQDRADPAMVAMENVFRTTRRQLPNHQEATMCQQVDYATNFGAPNFGVPFALNSTISINAFQMNVNQQHAPIVYQHPLITEQRVIPSRKGLDASFRAKLHCWKCGYQRKTHLRLGISFGDACHSNCLFDECSKCCERISGCHSNNLQGPFCPKAVSSKSKVATDWYTTNSTAARTI